MWKQPNNTAPPVASDKPLQQTADSRVKTTTTNIKTTTIAPTTSSNPTITMVATTLTSTPSTSITTSKHTPITTSMPTVVIPAVPMCTPVVQVVSSNSITTAPTTTPITTKRQNQPTIVTPPPQASVQQAPLALTTQTSRSPQPAHQQPPLQTTAMVGQPVPMISFPVTSNGPPSSLTIISKTPTASTNIKQEQAKVTCSLLDNGIRCDRVAGNASFSARIQKIVATKKLNFTLDPSVRHTYICDHHKQILTVAKKSTATPKDNSKSNARNYNTAQNNAANTLNNQPQPMVYNSADLSMMPGVISHHPVSIVSLNNQSRLAMNNHAGTPINNIPVRPGAQVAYTHYPGPQSMNQPKTVGNMDVMSTSFDQTGGDQPMPQRNNSGVDVDLQQLQVNTLRRYKKHFRVQTRPGLNKMQLAEVLKCHFRTLPIIEKEAITYFVYIAKCYLNKLDHVA